MNTSHNSWILFTNELNSGCYIWVVKIFGGCWKVVVGCVRQLAVLCSVSNTKYYLSGLLCGLHDEEVVFKTSLTVFVLFVLHVLLQEY